MAGIVFSGLVRGFVVWTAFSVAGTAAAQAPVCTYSVVNSFPHDAAAYTQGLIFEDGEFFESTGLYSHSTVRRVEVTTGIVLQSIDLSSDYFGEGLTLWEDRLIQLTYRENIAFVRNMTTFSVEETFSYTGEGWGLTHDGRVLILTDGSSNLRFFDPESYVELGSQPVTNGAIPVNALNELEWIRGEVFANIFTSDNIVRIDPDTGEVIAIIDLSGLHHPGGILNGIAWDDNGERLFITGKNWPTLYEIELVGAGCPELRLFGDGFESGETIRWSAVVE